MPFLFFVIFGSSLRTLHYANIKDPRIKFEEGSDSLEIVEWEEWFEPFDGRDLVFVYQDRRRDGRQSNFFRLDNPRREDG